MVATAWTLLTFLFTPLTAGLVVPKGTRTPMPGAQSRHYTDTVLLDTVRVFQCALSSAVDRGRISGFHKCKEILEWLHDRRIVKKGSDPCPSAPIFGALGLKFRNQLQFNCDVEQSTFLNLTFASKVDLGK